MSHYRSYYKTYVNYNKLFGMLHNDIWDFIIDESDTDDDYVSFINVVRGYLNNCTSFTRVQIKGETERYACKFKT